jgi:hypothetical protein
VNEAKKTMAALRKAARRLCRSFKIRGYRGVYQTESTESFGEFDPNCGKVGIRLYSADKQLLSWVGLVDTLCHELAHCALANGLHDDKHLTLTSAMVTWLGRSVRVRKRNT